MTGSRAPPPPGCCARAASSSAQLQNTIPAAAAAVFRKCRRLVISPPVLHAACCRVLLIHVTPEGSGASYLAITIGWSPRRRRANPAGPRSAGACRRRGAQVGARVGSRVGRDLAAARQAAPCVCVVGRAVDRLDADQRAVAVAEHRERSAFRVAAQHGAVVAGGQSGDLQTQLALLAPEPRQRLVWMRLADKPVGDAA